MGGRKYLCAVVQLPLRLRPTCGRTLEIHSSEYAPIFAIHRTFVLWTAFETLRDKDVPSLASLSFAALARTKHPAKAAVLCTE
jgi:hypothetical protein